MRAWIQVIGLVLVLTALVAALVVVRSSKSDSSTTASQVVETTSLRNEDRGIALRHPVRLAQTAISSNQQEIGMFFRAVDDSPPLLMSVRTESGLGALKVLGDILDTLVAQAEKRYPDQFPGYEKQRFEKQTIANEPGAVLEFTYTGTDEQTRVRQRLYFILVRLNRGYYISFQAPDDQFANIETEIATVLESLEFFEPETTNASDTPDDKTSTTE